MRYLCIDSCWRQRASDSQSKGASSHPEEEPLLLSPAYSALLSKAERRGLKLGLGVTASAEDCSELEAPPPAYALSAQTPQ